MKPAISPRPTPRLARRWSVLVIEDDEDTRRATIEQLLDRGLVVSAARDMRTAIDACALHRPEVIITELALPGARGYQFARSLRSFVEHDVIVVAATHMSARLFPQAVRAGFDYVFAKPFDIDAVLRAIL